MAFCDLDGVTILPRENGRETLVYDEDGEFVASFYGSWNEWQIKQALELANRACEKGYARGQGDKTREIKRVLDL